MLSENDEDLIKRQRDRMLKYYETHHKDNSRFNKKCALEIHGKKYIFESRKELDSFLKENYNFVMSRKLETKLLRTGERYNPFHKNKFNNLKGLRMYYIRQNENVETIGDECSRVGHGIGACPKRKTETENIVHST